MRSSSLTPAKGLPETPRHCWVPVPPTYTLTNRPKVAWSLHLVQAPHSQLAHQMVPPLHPCCCCCCSA